MQLAKWDDSFAVRLPNEVVESLDLKLGEELDASVQNGVLRISRKRTREEILERLRRFQGWMPEDFRFDRDEANAR